VELPLDDLRGVIRRAFRCESVLVEAVPVSERLHGRVVWQGAVAVFDLAEHPGRGTRAHARSYLTDGGERRFTVFLHSPPIDSPLAAVRASLVAEQDGRRDDDFWRKRGRL
jgi:hypothetical protein